MKTALVCALAALCLPGVAPADTVDDLSERSATLLLQALDSPEIDAGALVSGSARVVEPPAPWQGQALAIVTRDRVQYLSRPITAEGQEGELEIRYDRASGDLIVRSRRSPVAKIGRGIDDCRRGRTKGRGLISASTWIGGAAQAPVVAHSTVVGETTATFSDHLFMPTPIAITSCTGACAPGGIEHFDFDLRRSVLIYDQLLALRPTGHYSEATIDISQRLRSHPVTIAGCRLTMSCAITHSDSWTCQEWYEDGNPGGGGGDPPGGGGV